MGRFRTPSLRNVAVTAPYMHDGSAATLGQVIDDSAAGERPGPVIARTSPRPSQGLQPVAGEKADLLAIFDALTDRTFLASEALRSPVR